MINLKEKINISQTREKSQYLLLTKQPSNPGYFLSKKRVQHWSPVLNSTALELQPKVKLHEYMSVVKFHD